MTAPITKAALAPDKLREIVLPELRQLTGATSDWTVAGPVVRAREGDVYKAQAEAFPGSIALKLYRSEIRSPADQRSEFEALSFIHPRLTERTPEFAVPKAHFFLETPGVLAMEWIEAISVRRLLWRSLITPSRRLEIIARAGHFLKNFYEVSDIVPGKVRPGRYVRILKLRIDAYAPAQRLAEESRLFIEGLALLKETSAFLRKTPLPFAISHGDLTPSNLLMDSKRTFAIDLAGKQRLPLYEDISKFLTYLVSDYPIVPGSGRTRIAGLRQKEWEAFWRHNDTPPADGQLPAFLHIHLHRLLRRWIKVQGRSFARRTNLSLKQAVQALIDKYERDGWKA